MIDDTKKKLREAEFFYNHLVEENKKNIKNEPDAFHFYLSAFMSAARSVTFVLQVEDKKNYDSWFPTWFESLSDHEQQVMSLSKDLRNYLLKEGVSNTSISWEYIPLTNLRSTEAENIKWFGPPGTPPPQLGRPIHMLNLGDNDMEVISVCGKYLGLIKSLIAEFEDNFSNKED